MLCSLGRYCEIGSSQVMEGVAFSISSNEGTAIKITVLLLCPVPQRGVRCSALALLVLCGYGT